ncbi:nucleolar complex protein 2 homolog [Saccoglossus kowalevskii]
MLKLVSIWSTGEETSRVLAFLSIYRLSYNLQESMLEFSLKQMYMGYVRNCKFTSPSVLPMINFMQRSLTEIFAINIQVTYQHAFIYIRQLAIHLRNAITTKKKDTYQAVYNWQYIHCLYLWCRVLSTIQPIGMLQPLIYPLVQITMGAIKLIYYDINLIYYDINLVYYDINLIYYDINLMHRTLCEQRVFEQTDWNRKHSSISFKPINFAIVLKLSKSQLQERAFKDGLIDQLYDLLMEHLNIHSHCIGFPELALPLIVELKTFLKKCKIVNYCRQMKSLLDKIQDNCAVISKRRDATTINLSDDAAVVSWEIRSKQEGTPIGNLYKTYKNLRERELKHASKNKFDDHVVIERKKKKEKDKKEMTGLFVSSDDDSDIDTFFDPGDKKMSMDRKKEKRVAVQDEVSESDDDDNTDDENEDDDEEEVDEIVVKETKEQLQKKHKLGKGDVDDEEDIVEEFELSSSEEEVENDDDDDDNDDDDDDDDDDDEED